jgi:serine/threonine protein phosphatase PrpC
MQCPKCTAQVLENQRFCEECGTRIVPLATAASAGATCHCPPGMAAPDENGYCENCGFRVVATEHVAPVKLDVAPDLAMVSDRGRHHPVNQDAGIVGRSSSGAVVIAVADGVSSSDKADVASATAIAAAYEVMMEAAGDEVGTDVVTRAVAAAHAAVIAIPYTDTRREEPETTIVVALVRGKDVTVAWVGDSRAYAINSKYARLITRDDSWLADAVEGGSMTMDEALADRRSHSITQCLGMLDDDIHIHTRSMTLDPDTWLLLCTDGLWNYLDQLPAMADAVAQAGQDADAFELCEHMVKLANHAGGHDNITVASYRSAAA